MKGSNILTLACAAGTLLLSGSALPGALTPAQVRQLAQNANHDVIVILRDQLAGVPGARGAREARGQAVAAAQSPILTELQQVGAPRIRSFALINAVAARISTAEMDRLAAHPLVQAVVPDAVIRLRHRSVETADAAARTATAAPAAASGLCNTLEPEALQLTHAAFPDTGIPQAQQIVTGRGVKVAWIADGLDPNIAGFIRADGSHVFIDYQDFSGDPAGTPTGGGEAFGDASSIAAQDHDGALTYDISQFVNPVHPLPTPCNIRVRGMAPGASLVGLKAFGSFTTTSALVQAIEWAVNVDDVDVLNESFGGNPYPDNANDPISLADEAAVRAGVTVVVSSGDAGTAGTLGSPSTDAGVISVGATTQYRLYAQTGYPELLLTSGGYLDNNVSAFSSGGVSFSRGRTVDVVAPGESGWALCSVNTTLFTECTNFKSQPSPIEDFGGTSESSPLTAGEAALVIEAYRRAHGGASPAPALVKRIIMSTATDLGAPATEQGAGLINALKAVNAALSVDASPHGHALLANPPLASVTDKPDASETRSFTITNTGTTTQHLTPRLQRLGSPLAGASLTVHLNPATDPTLVTYTGAKRSYVTQNFSVPAGARHLDAAIAWHIPTSEPTLIAYLALIDANGRLAAYSIPQGFSSGYGHVDVVNPAAGTWTAYIFTRPAGAVGSYAGAVQFTWSAEGYANLGSVSPSQLDLAPGQSETITARFRMPDQPGDLSSAIRLGEIADEDGDRDTRHAEIPVIVRTLVPTSRAGGAFTGTLTGGNGRAGAGNSQTYAFDVPDGVNNMSLSLGVSDNGYLLEGVLVDPHGMELSVEPNLDYTGAQTNALALFRSNPQPGRWRFELVQDFFSSGNQTSLPFAAQIGFDTAQVTANGLPQGATLKAGVTVAVPIVITNTGSIAQLYFLDARLRAPAEVALPTQPLCPSATLPGACALLWVPPEVRSLSVAAQSSSPIQMDTFPLSGNGVAGTGAPDLFARPVAPNTVVASLSVPEAPFGPWEAVPALIGPFGASGAPTAPVSTAAVALMQPFDSAVTSDTGDLWSVLVTGAGGFTPAAVPPGGLTTVNAYITPAGPSGTVVKGYLYVDTYNPNVSTGDEVIRFPYSYTIQ